MQVHLVLLILFRGHFFGSFAGFWEPPPSFQAWLRIGADLCQVRMDSRRFHQARMKKCQVGNEEMQLKWCRMQCRRSGISLWHSKNFAILAKFRYGHNFAMIAKFRYDSEISLS